MSASKYAQGSSVKSPCTNICSLDEDDICIGCFRSGKEISLWGRVTDKERLEILENVYERERNSPLVSGC